MISNWIGRHMDVDGARGQWCHASSNRMKNSVVDIKFECTGHRWSVWVHLSRHRVTLCWLGRVPADDTRRCRCRSSFNFRQQPKNVLKFLLHQEWQQMKRSKSDSTVILSLYLPVANLSLSLNHQSDPGQPVISKKLGEERLLSTAAIKRLIIIHRKLNSPAPHSITISPFW
jgi:hypothetical protein